MSKLIPLEEVRKIYNKNRYSQKVSDGYTESCPNIIVDVISLKAIEELESLPAIDPIASLEESIYGWVNVRVKGCSPSLCCDGLDFDSEMFKVLDEKLLWLTKVHREIDAMIEFYKKLSKDYKDEVGHQAELRWLVLQELKSRLSPNQK